MRLLRRAALLSFILLGAAVESPPRAPAAQGTPPQTMHGVYRYRVRGLTAAGGLFSGAFKAQGMYNAAVNRVLPGFFKILSGMAQVSSDPSAKEMHDFLRSGDLSGLDLSIIPIAAGFGAEIEFTLELVKKEWRLKRGSYRWSSDTHFSFSGGEASLSDNVRGQGSGALDPKTASITLVNTGKKGSPRLELLGDIPLTSGFTSGKSVARNGIMSMSLDLGTGVMEIVVPGLTAIRNRLGEPGENYSVGYISFSKSGPPEQVMKGREVYQDLLDAGVVEEWELWDECAARIEEPKDNAELVYDDKKPGRLIHRANADVQPSFWDDDLHWDLPQIEGSTLDTPPEKANGNDFPVTYTNLPEKNSAFKLTEVKARFDTDRAKRAGCKDPQQSDVGYFFARSALNHGGLPGLKAKDNFDNRPNPNWLHYWMQTKANVGLPWRFVRYGGTAGTCKTALGYYPPGEKHVVLCDPRGFTKYNPFRPESIEGIDFFAAVLLHEKRHHDDYWQWWAAGHDIDLDSDPVNPKANWRGKAGLQGDWIPDLLEHTVPVPPQIRARKGARFSPKRQDSFGYKLDDEHYLAYAAEFQWQAGSADREDWSCPGHQTFQCGQ